MLRIPMLPIPKDITLSDNKGFCLSCGECQDRYETDACVCETCGGIVVFGAEKTPKRKQKKIK